MVRKLTPDDVPDIRRPEGTGYVPLLEEAAAQTIAPTSEAGTGDMLASMYDPDGDGMVDYAETTTGTAANATLLDGNAVSVFVRTDQDSTIAAGVTVSVDGAIDASANNASANIGTRWIEFVEGADGADFIGSSSTMRVASVGNQLDISCIDGAPSVYLVHVRGKVGVAGDLGVDGNILVLDSTNGMKVATSSSEKLGFWGATPVAKTAVADLSGATAGGTYGATEQTMLQAVYDKVNEVLNALQAAGLV